MPYTPPPDYIPPPDAKASGYIPPPDYVPPPDAVEAKPEMPPTFRAIPEKDGSVSLIPTLDASGRALNPEEAEAQYLKTGNKFGTYASVGEAQKAGQDLYTKQLNAPMMPSHGPASGTPPAVKPNMLYVPGMGAPMPIGN